MAANAASFFKRHGATIVAVAVALVATAFYWAWPDNGLTGNVVTEGWGIAFTVGLLDLLLATSRKQRERLARYAAYKELRLILSRAVQVWMTIVRQSNSEIPVGTPLFDENLVQGSIVVDFRAPSKVIPPRTYGSLLTMEQAEIQQRVDRFMQRYIQFVDPEIVSAVHELEECALFNVLRLASTIEGLEHSARMEFGGKTNKQLEADLPVTALAQAIGPLAAEFALEPGHRPLPTLAF